MTKYCLALHGGAGTILNADDPEAIKPYQDALLAALAAGDAVLSRGGGAVDAVVEAVKSLEDCPLFNAGHGAVFTEDGVHELDAAVMDGQTLNAGAIAGARRIRNPIVAARELMRVGKTVFLAGEGADRFALQQGLPAVSLDYFSTDRRRDQLREVRLRRPDSQQLDHDVDVRPGRSGGGLGTVGAVARDRFGQLAAATSTGGMTNKPAGRIGDSPVIGAGTYASRLCAVSATGAGELFIRRCAAHEVDSRMRYLNESLIDAVKFVIHDDSRLQLDGGLIAVDSLGNICLQQTERMYRAWRVEGQVPVVAVGRNTGADEFWSGEDKAGFS
jgi:beta-aspartyl-peptidase (threonine type)